MKLLTRCLLLTLALATPLAAYAKPPAAAAEPPATPAAPPAPAATSMLRVTCEGDNAGAEVTVNGKFKGECPLDMQVAPGMLQLRVEKKDPSYERVFEQEIRMGDGVVKKVEAVLSKNLNAAGKSQFEAQEAQIAANMIRIPGKNYELGKYEVTQGEWKAVMGSPPPELYFKNCGDTCPVEQVSWNDVQEYLQKLNSHTGKQYRLPTEAEWEYACYGGSQTEYCGGNNIDSVAWYESNSGKTTHPVGQKQANGYGLFDMSGNVWEWMSDCYARGCAERVLRGGSWLHEARVTRAAFSNEYDPATRSINFGFRLARTLP